MHHSILSPSSSHRIPQIDELQEQSIMIPTILLLSSICHFAVANGQASVAFRFHNKCPFPVWPAAAPNAGHPVIAAGGFLLLTNRTRHVRAPPTWNGRFWARTGCDFSSSRGCRTGDCQGRLACNGTIGTPPATLVEVSLQGDESVPSFYDVSLVDGYNLPVSVSTRPAVGRCSIGGCARDVNSVCPRELQVVDEASGTVVACKSACLAFDLDAFCCRNAYGTPESCRDSVYSRVFKGACPEYFSYAYDAPPPLVNCHAGEYVVTFCPAGWGGAHLPL